MTDVGADRPFDPVEFLRAQGVPEVEIQRAVEGGWIDLLLIDRWILPGERRWNRAQTAEQAGIDIDVADRFWRAMGFPTPDDDALVFTDDDVDQAAKLRDRLDVSPDLEWLLQQTRVMATSMSHIAETLTDGVARLTDEVGDLVPDPMDRARAVPDLIEFEDLVDIFRYVFRRQLHISFTRRFLTEEAAGGDLATSTVGFADLVGFTALSQQLDPAELSELVAAFERITFDIISGAGGRVVKRIGDEVMFSVGDAIAGVEVALALIETLGEERMELRVGLARGEVLLREGDMFGPTVNLASRLVSIARPGSIVIDETTHEAVSEMEGIRLRPMGRRRVRDVGMQRLWRLRPAAVEEPDPVGAGDGGLPLPPKPLEVAASAMEVVERAARRPRR